MKQFVKNIFQGSFLLQWRAERVKDQRYDLAQDERMVKVNLGCGLKVCPGYINVDYNMPSLFSSKNKIALTILYLYLKIIRYSELKRPFRFTITKDKFIDIMKNNKFIFFSLLNGIPFENDSVDFYYSSHMIGYAFPQDISKKILKEIHRTLRKNGALRLSLTDGDQYWKQHNGKLLSGSYNTNDNCFTYDEIEKALTDIGFVEVRKVNFMEGRYPDLKELDDYSPEIDRNIGTKTMYIEASK